MRGLILSVVLFATMFLSSFGAFTLGLIGAFLPIAVFILPFWIQEQLRQRRNAKNPKKDAWEVPTQRSKQALKEFKEMTQK